MAKRIEYVLGIETKDGLRYVTEILPRHWAKWEAGKEAKTFTKETAMDIARGFAFNFTVCHVIIKQDFMIYQNPIDEDNNKEADTETE